MAREEIGKAERLKLDLLVVIFGIILIGGEWSYCIIRDILLGIKKYFWKVRYE